MSDQNPDKFFINPELVQQLVQQLEKDFIHSHIFVNRDKASLKGDEIFDLVHVKVKELMSKNYTELANTFYRVDISEKQLKDALHVNSAKEESELITELILKRELQKVVYRNIYKQNKEDDTSA